MSHNKMMSAKKLNALQEQLKQIHFEMYKHEQILKSPSEYSMIVKICEKYDLSENIEELINHYLQKSKFKESLKIFNKISPNTSLRFYRLYDEKIIKPVKTHWGYEHSRAYCQYQNEYKPVADNDVMNI